MGTLLPLIYSKHLHMKRWWVTPHTFTPSPDCVLFFDPCGSADSCQAEKCRANSANFSWLSATEAPPDQRAALLIQGTQYTHNQSRSHQLSAIQPASAGCKLRRNTSLINGVAWFLIKNLMCPTFQTNRSKSDSLGRFLIFFADIIPCNNQYLQSFYCTFVMLTNHE